MQHFFKILLFSCFLLGLKALMAAPIPASCTPATLNYCCGFGITKVTFKTINYPSNDGIDGYSDFTNASATLSEGQSYSLTIQTNASSTQNFAAWIDFNNDGVFDDITERVFTATSQHNPVGNVTIPTGAVLNTDLRLRIISDYDFNAAPMPCTSPERGQVEDYTVVITQNSSPPVAAFSTTDTLVCDGAVCFTDNSLNLPTSWLWYFGDGGTSLQENPCHTYTADGTYSVSLIVTNANGSDADTNINYITVNLAGQVATPSCTPPTTAYCCGYGIVEVHFADIHNTTPDGVEGYQDFSCTHFTNLYEGNSYLFTTNTGTTNPQNTKVWIDFNNDGMFNNTNELVMDAPNAFSPSKNITVPSGAVMNTPLRLRISSDIVGGAQLACDTNDRGQTEDYGVIINEPNNVNESFATKHHFVLYPNPTQHTLYIKNLMSSETIEELKVYNAIGQQVLTIVQNGVNHIDVSEYDKGIYMLSIRTSKAIVSKKFIVE